MTKILTFIDWYTPAYKAGGPIRSVRNIVEGIGDQVEFYIVTGDADFGEDLPMPDIEANQWTKKGNANVIFLSKDKQNKNYFRTLYDEVKPDFIYLNSLFSPIFTLNVLREFKSERKKIVLAPRGMLGMESLKIKATKKKVFLKISKILSLYKEITWHATNQIECDLIKGQFGEKAKVKIAPNLPFLPKAEPKQIAKDEGHLKLVSVSRIVPIKNLALLFKSLLKVKSKVELTIVGPDEDPVYRKLCLDIIDSLPSNIKVLFAGQIIPDDIGQFYENAHVYVSPTLNENYGHSIVEAFGFGRPVIISDKTPWLNLEKKAIGYDLELKEDLFTEKIEFYANLNQDQFNLASNNARAFAKKELLNEQLILASLNLFKA